VERVSILTDGTGAVVFLNSIAAAVAAKHVLENKQNRRSDQDSRLAPRVQYVSDAPHLGMLADQHWVDSRFIH